jgi:hypothetical protein
MSVQPPVAPHRIAVVDIDISFWRMVGIIIKWMFAAIPAAIIFSIIIALISIAIGAIFGGILGGLNIPGVKL